LDYRIFKAYSWILYALGLLVLIAVLFFGKTVRGTTGWFSIFGLTIGQPAEIVKVFLIIALSKYLTDHIQDLYKFKYIIYTGILCGLFVLLILLQPDFASAILLLAIWICMLFFTNTKKSHLIFIIVIILLMMVFSWFFLLQDYQKERIITFFNPARDPLGKGYNPIQSIVAVGSGKLWGRGLGLGPQSQLNFLPAQETDFIFAVIAEELGFVGSFVIILLFGLILYRLFKSMNRARDNFSHFLILGTVSMLFIQIFITIGMNIGIMPVAGLPLPLVSYGGSSLITTMIIIGIIEGIIIRQRTGEFH
jgi:rod shape determining protein RodA